MNPKDLVGSAFRREADKLAEELYNRALKQSPWEDLMKPSVLPSAPKGEAFECSTQSKKDNLRKILIAEVRDKLPDELARDVPRAILEGCKGQPPIVVGSEWFSMDAFFLFQETGEARAMFQDILSGLRAAVAANVPVPLITAKGSCTSHLQTKMEEGAELGRFVLEYRYPDQDWKPLKHGSL